MWGSLIVWAQIKKFGPLAAIAGYLTLYSTKGFDRILTDLQTITPEKIMAKWQNIAIIVGAGVGLYFITKSKLPAPIKAVAIVALWYVIGYNGAVVIDPPYVRRSTGVQFVRPLGNPYAAGGK